MKRHPHETTVLALFKNAPEAQAATDTLATLPLEPQDISILFSEEAYDKEELVKIAGSDFWHEETVRAGKVGGIFGAIVAGAVAITAMVSGGASLFAAGPIVALIAAAGGIGGSLFSAGFTEEQAQEIDEGLRQGQVLVLVHAANRELGQRSEEILRSRGAVKIRHHH